VQTVLRQEVTVGRAACQTWPMGVRPECRHYSSRSTGDDLVQRCRVGANEEAPFACPEDCLFFEPRKISETGWQRQAVDDDETA